jgi:hypothetical protein
VLFADGDEPGGALVWRSVWDREADAADFVDRVAGEGRGTFVRDGRLVDWIAATDPAVTQRLAAACAAARELPAPEPADAASTETAEAELRAAAATSRDDGAFWRHDALGLAVPIPAGWELREVNGVTLLLHVAAATPTFTANVNVLPQPRGGLVDLAALAATTRAQFEQLELGVEQLEVVQRGEAEVLVAEYHGRIGRMPPMHFLALAYLRGAQQVWVTATTRADTWPDQEAALRALMAGVRVTPP